jgi:hypothetical protein
MKNLSKAAFFEADDLPLESVELPSDLYGEDVCLRVRTMTGHERSDLEKRFVGREAADEPGDFRATLLLLCVVDEAGEPFFEPTDREALMGKNAGTLETIFEKACELNGFRDKDVEAMAKNSETSPAS